MLLPIRARALQFISTLPQATVEEVMEGLRSEYGQERQFTKANFVEHMLALKANGLIDEVACELDDNNELVITYKINDEGITTIKKYIPKKFQ